MQRLVCVAETASQAKRKLGSATPELSTGSMILATKTGPDAADTAKDADMAAMDSPPGSPTGAGAKASSPRSVVD